jgi:hypothetical protein
MVDFFDHGRDSRKRLAPILRARRIRGTRIGQFRHSVVEKVANPAVSLRPITSIVPLARVQA